LLINPNTVARAYRELEHAGVVVKRGTVGTFVSDNPSPFARRERLRVLRQRIDALLADASHMGIDLDELKSLIDERDEAMHAERKAKGVLHEK
jgi:GntR family transcriptional regulator